VEEFRSLDGLGFGGRASFGERHGLGNTIYGKPVIALNARVRSRYFHGWWQWPGGCVMWDKADLFL